MSTGTTCPRCGCYARLLKNGNLGQHRTQQHAIGQIRGGRVREHCPYSGCTPVEARAGVTSLAKLVAAYQAKQANAAQAALDKHAAKAKQAALDLITEIEEAG